MRRSSRTHAVEPRRRECRRAPAAPRSASCRPARARTVASRADRPRRGRARAARSAPPRAASSQRSITAPVASRSAIAARRLDETQGRRPSRHPTAVIDRAADDRDRALHERSRRAARRGAGAARPRPVQAAPEPRRACRHRAATDGGPRRPARIRTPAPVTGDSTRAAFGAAVEVAAVELEADVEPQRPERRPVAEAEARPRHADRRG